MILRWSVFTLYFLHTSDILSSLDWFTQTHTPLPFFLRRRTSFLIFERHFQEEHFKEETCLLKSASMTRQVIDWLIPQLPLLSSKTSVWFCFFGIASIYVSIRLLLCKNLSSLFFLSLFLPLFCRTDETSTGDYDNILTSLHHHFERHARTQQEHNTPFL